MQRFGLILVAVLALALSAPARAQLTRDEAIGLARQVQFLQQSVDALNVRLGKMEGATPQNQQLLGLLKEVETLRAEVARIRGQAEVQTHQLDTLGKRQNDLYVDLDQRIADIAKQAIPATAVAVEAPVAPSAPTHLATVAPPAPPADTVDTASAQTPLEVESAPVAPVATQVMPQLDPLVESRSYETALDNFRAGNYAGAITGFRGFLNAYPDSALASNAQYWIGYSYYVLKDYKAALSHQQRLVAAYPGSAKVPDALFNIANNLAALDDFDGARKTLEELVDRYPGTKAASLAARRLALFK